MIFLATAVLIDVVRKWSLLTIDCHCRSNTSQNYNAKLPNYSNRSTRFILSCRIVRVIVCAQRKDKKQKNENRNGNNRCGHRWLHNKTTIPNNVVHFKRNYEFIHTLIYSYFSDFFFLLYFWDLPNQRQEKNRLHAAASNTISNRSTTHPILWNFYQTATAIRKKALFDSYCSVSVVINWYLIERSKFIVRCVNSY